jgi:hypothetical protein
VDHRGHPPTIRRSPEQIGSLGGSINRRGWPRDGLVLNGCDEVAPPATPRHAPRNLFFFPHPLPKEKGFGSAVAGVRGAEHDLAYRSEGT